MKRLLLIFALASVSAWAQQPAPMLPNGPSQGVAAEYHFSVEEMAAREQKLVITKQEAEDVVKALEILTESGTAQSYLVIMPSTNDLVYRPGGMSAKEKADNLRGELARYEEQAKFEEKRAADLDWARSILAAWRKKVEACK